MNLNRRLLIGAGAASLALPAFAFGPATSKRLVVVVLRGGMDGLAALMPVGDRAYATARGAMAEPRPADGAPIAISPDFALHPALANSARLWKSGTFGAVVAVATPYRDRSHFDAQQVLESGGTAPHGLDSGWLNRLLPLIDGGPALAIAPTVPLALRGPARAGSYAPSALPDASPDLLARIESLYAGDALFAPLWKQALAARALAGDADRGRANPVRLAEMAARFLVEPGGPRVAMIEQDGWDTHANQPGRIAAQLATLDRMLAALQTGLGAAWGSTLVLVATEFGRTVRPNGTGGTDHGTGGLMLLGGGAANGGRVHGDWPGLAPAALHEGRDLRPTTDMRAVLLGAVTSHFALDPARVAPALFPGTPVRPMPGLVRATPRSPRPA